MKILHTADWHLGKRLFGVSRLGEQAEVLNEIASIADSEGVDAVLAAGDIFDTAVPPAEAEELFYSAAIKMAAGGRAFVAVAGNHDDPLRLSAPSGIAKALNIFLVGGFDNSAYKRSSVSGGEGFIKIDLKGGRLNLLCLPYPQHSRIAAFGDKDSGYSELCGAVLKKFAENAFDNSGVNVTLSHLFMTPERKSGGKEIDTADILSDERSLGTAVLLSPDILPAADYTALGHIHKPLTVSKTRNAYYGGSILNYSFDDLTEKSVILVDVSGGKTTVKRIALKSGKRLVKARVEDFFSGQKVLQENSEAYVLLQYAGGVPLSASEVNALKKEPSLARIENISADVIKRAEFRPRSDEELFTDFYKFKNRTDTAPDKELVRMFLAVLNGEDV